jgi:hypothetical protein
MVTPAAMRAFAAECLRWSDKTSNASHRSLMVGVATTWAQTAAAIERRIALGDEQALPDLRTKLD